MEVILVDEKDNPVGTEEKLKAHKEGLLHRAFSVFIFNSKNELLLQKRALSKYHSPGLWTNTCCSHPCPGKELAQEAKKRLKEEMGFSCDIREMFSFIYKVKFQNGLTENEFDHVFIGKYNSDPKPDPEEVSDWKWVNLENLKKDITEKPAAYTFWLRTCIDKIRKTC